jgi:hypothetical protein
MRTFPSTLNHAKDRGAMTSIKMKVEALCKLVDNTTETPTLFGTPDSVWLRDKGKEKL